MKTPREIVIILALMLLLGGCAAFGSLARSVAGSSWLGTVISLAQATMSSPALPAVLEAKRDYDACLGGTASCADERQAVLDAWAVYLASVAPGPGVTTRSSSPAVTLPTVAEVDGRL
jgi:hypothetical protein